MITLNVNINTEWQEVEIKLASNSIIDSTSRPVWFWVGTTPPTPTSIGHILKMGDSLSNDKFEVGDLVWFKSDGNYKITVTR